MDERERNELINECMYAVDDIAVRFVNRVTDRLANSDLSKEDLENLLNALKTIADLDVQ